MDSKERVAVIAATLRKVAEWQNFAAMVADGSLLADAQALENGDAREHCAVCGWVTCEPDCPLAPVRATTATPAPPEPSHVEQFFADLKAEIERGGWPHWPAQHLGMPPHPKPPRLSADQRLDRLEAEYTAQGWNKLARACSVVPTKGEP